MNKLAACVLQLLDLQRSKLVYPVSGRDLLNRVAMLHKEIVTQCEVIILHKEIVARCEAVMMHKKIFAQREVVMLHKKIVAQCQIGVVTAGRKVSGSFGTTNGIICTEDTEDLMIYARKSSHCTLIVDVAFRVWQHVSKLRTIRGPPYSNSNINNNQTAIITLPAPPYIGQPRLAGAMADVQTGITALWDSTSATSDPFCTSTAG